jgi:hypothetical protein
LPPRETWRRAGLGALVATFEGKGTAVWRVLGASTTGASAVAATVDRFRLAMIDNDKGVRQLSKIVETRCGARYAIRRLMW